MNIKNVSITLLKEYDNNPRNNEAAVEKVAESIQAFGFKVPIIVDKDHVIVAGHTRLKAAQKLGLEEVPVIIADDLTPAQVKAFRLADNKVSEYATWDEEKLFTELMELEMLDFSIERFGFETKEISPASESYDYAEEEAAPLNTETNFSYKEQYGVIVVCKDESEQEKVYNTLLEMGYECKVVTT